MNDELRRRVEEKFAEHYPDLKVTVRSASLIEGEGIEVRGLSISQPGATGPRAELVHFDEIMMNCDARLSELLQREPKVTKVVIRGAVFLPTRRADGTWSTERLLPIPQFTDHPPTIVAEGCRFEFFDPLRNPTSTLVLRDIHLQMTPQAAPAGGRVANNRVQGFMTADCCQRIEFSGMLTDGGASFDFTGGAEGLDLSPELFASLPGPLADKLDELRALRAQSRFRFAAKRKGANGPLEFDIDGALSRGRIEDSRLPFPLTDLTARFRCTNSGVHVSDLRARNGQTELAIRQAWRRGYADGSPCYVEMNCQQLVIDRRLLDVLPEHLRVSWYDYFLAGVVNVKGSVLYDGQAWRPDIALECVDTSFTYHKFPYRLENGRGALRLKDDLLDFWLTAYSGADQFLLKGQVQNLTHEPGLWMELQAERVTIDRKLLEALPVEQRHVISSMQPAGRFSLFAEARRQPGAGQPLEHIVRLGLDHCSLKYEKFPYPVYNVCGTIEAAGGAWEFRNLEGNNDTAEIRGYGRLGPTSRGKELELHLTGTGVALEDELRNALPENYQRSWQTLQPRGSVNLGADVRFVASPRQLNISLGVAPVGETVSIEPRFLPYRIEAIQGEFAYQDGRITLGRQPGGTLKGRHQGVDLAVRGQCDIAANGSWRLVLDDFNVYRLRADRDLQTAVPAKLNQWLRKLDPNDPYNIRGKMELVGSGLAGELPQANWHATIALNRARFNGVMPLENIFGLAHVRGQYDGKRLLADAELDFDSLTCRDLQLTRVTGPVRVDNEKVLLGAWAQQVDANGKLRPITAQAYGGWLLSDGWIRLEETPRFGVQIVAGDLDVEQIAREVVPGAQQLTGKANGVVNVQGTTEGLHTLSGTGQMRLRDADLYQLPQMVAILNILSLKPPDKASLTHSEADFRIDGDHLYFDRINFTGDAISLRGQGEMNFQSELALTLYATVGRGELPIPLIPDLFRAASQQIMLIHVNGKVSDPIVQRDPFPMVNQALGQIAGGPGPGLETPPELGTRRGERGWLNNPEARPIFPLQSGRSGGLTR